MSQNISYTSEKYYSYSLSPFILNQYIFPKDPIHVLHLIINILYINLQKIKIEYISMKVQKKKKVQIPVKKQNQILLLQQQQIQIQ